MLGRKRALHKVALDDLFRLSNGGQVQALVPTQEQVQVGVELFVGGWRQCGNAGLRKAFSICSAVRIQCVTLPPRMTMTRAASRNAAKRAREAALLS